MSTTAAEFSNTLPTAKQAKEMLALAEAEMASEALRQKEKADVTPATKLRCSPSPRRQRPAIRFPCCCGTGIGQRERCTTTLCFMNRSNRTPWVLDTCKLSLLKTL